MKKLSFFLIPFIAFGNIWMAQAAPNAGVLTVNVSNVKHREGNLKAILQDKSNFLTPQFVGCIEIKPTSNNAQMVLKTCS